MATCVVLVAVAGCRQSGGATMDWVRVETDDLIIRTDARPELAKELAGKWQRLRDAIAENELPCAFDRSNVPMEMVLLHEEQDMIDLFRRFTAGLTVPPPSVLLDSKTQYVLVRKDAVRNTQLFAHELAHDAVSICFPTARPWLHEGMASFYETAQIRDGELLIGMPAYGFVPMINVEPTADIYPVVVNQTEVWMLPSRLAPDFDQLRMMDAEQFYFLGNGRSPDELRKTTAHYAGAWHAVHLLQFGPRTLRGRFSTYLTRLAAGEDDDKAWGRAFSGVDVGARYRDYLTAHYKMGSRPIEVSSSREPSVHRMSPTDVALLWARLHGWWSEAEIAESRAYLERASRYDPTSTDVMLHWAAFHHDIGEELVADQWIERALAQPGDDPRVLATAILWFSGREKKADRMEDLRRWGEALGRSAQTAFELAEYGEYLLRVAGDPEGAVQQLDSSLILDATAWRTYALAGQALEELGRMQAALRAYQTAIALGEAAPGQARDLLKRRVAEIERQRLGDTQPPNNHKNSN